jgi:class 3 adenylate cyclase
MFYALRADFLFYWIALKGCMGVAMTLKDDLAKFCEETFFTRWEVKEKSVIPVPSDLRLSNDAGHFSSLVILYADLNGSTKMVDGKTWEFSAEIYKTYLHCAAKIIKSEGGTITAYDGDRIMAVFDGGTKNTSAVRAAMKITWSINNIISPKMEAMYHNGFKLLHSVGIDSSPINVARIGVRNDNDLVWVGPAANHAAKMTAIPFDGNVVWIGSDVYRNMLPEACLAGGVNMWNSYYWMDMQRSIYYSTYQWRVD